MGGQVVERREVLRVIALASAAAAFPGFSRWAAACSHGTPANEGAKSSPFEPQFLTADEFKMVDRLVDLIIPADDTPGARDAGVAEFIDFMVAHGAGVQDRKFHAEVGDAAQVRVRSGLAWMNVRCQWLYGRVFLECSEEQQTELLEHLAFRDRYRPNEEEGQAFFQLVRDYTMMGFYTSRIGMEHLGSPGLQTMWAEMPACPHTDDPEHVRLTQPTA